MVQNPDRHDPDPTSVAASSRQHGPKTGATEAPGSNDALKRWPLRSGGKSRIALVAALVAVAALLGVAAWRETSLGAMAHGGQQGSGQADIGGPFKLTDQDGRAVDQRVLQGKWSAVFFGYTYCPDTCPATLQALAGAQTQLTPAQQKAFQVVFVSVDPARDTPAQMKLYLTSQAFPRGAIGLTGTPSQVADVARAYHVYYAKQGAGPDYAVQHSAAIYLMDPQGRFLKPLDESQPPGALATQIKTAMTG